VTLAELEARYASAPLGPPPRGLFRGRHLGRIPDRKVPYVVPIDRVLFEWMTFGIRFADDDSGRWWFMRPGLAAGRFDQSPGPSRWRDTQTRRLVYHRSRLPRPVRGMLYDEVKMLDTDRGLGIGGLNRGRGEGDFFFYSIERIG
jgi:hypothetical protein